MNIESYVFILCYGFLGLIAIYSVCRIISLEREIERKKQLIKVLQRENQFLRGDSENV